MQYIISAIGFIIAWILKKVANKVVYLPFITPIFALRVMSITLYLAAFSSFTYFLLKIVNNLFDILNKINNYNPSGSSDAYGISVSSIWNMFIGFLSASGLADALKVSLSLFFTLLFLYFGVKITFAISDAFKNVADQLSSSVELLKGD